jgi:hypothetical protein
VVGGTQSIREWVTIHQLASLWLVVQYDLRSARRVNLVPQSCTGWLDARLAELRPAAQQPPGRFRSGF